MIYLDHNASTPVDPEVAASMHAAVMSNYGNPSSGHDIGAKAKRAIEEARARVAEMIGASPEEIFFTSGGTESNNLAIMGLAHAKGRGRIITSAIEHPSVLNPCRHLEEKGFDISRVGVDRDGRVLIEETEKECGKEAILVTIMHANNETGVLQPIEEIGAIARARGIPFHTDAAQTIGQIPVLARELNVDMMTIVSHKFYGPKGIGALYVRKGISLRPILFGAGHERGLRPGTENVPGIVGLGEACEQARLRAGERASHTRKLTGMLYSGLRERIGAVRLNGHPTLRLPNTLNVSFPSVDSTALLGTSINAPFSLSPS